MSTVLIGNVHAIFQIALPILACLNILKIYQIRQEMAMDFELCICFKELVIFRRIPKVTPPVTFRFSRQKGPLLSGSRYFRMVKKRYFVIFFKGHLIPFLHVINSPNEQSKL